MLLPYQDQFFLRFRDKFGTIFRDQNHLFDGHDAMLRDFQTRLNSEYHAFFYWLKGFIGIFFPSRSQQGCPIMRKPPYLVASDLPAKRSCLREMTRM